MYHQPPFQPLLCRSGGVTPISINDSSYNTIPLACLHYNTYLAKCQYIYLKMYKVTSYM